MRCRLPEGQEPENFLSLPFFRPGTCTVPGVAAKVRRVKGAHLSHFHPVISGYFPAKLLPWSGRQKNSNQVVRGQNE